MTTATATATSLPNDSTAPREVREASKANKSKKRFLPRIWSRHAVSSSSLSATTTEETEVSSLDPSCFADVIRKSSIIPANHILPMEVEVVYKEEASLLCEEGVEVEVENLQFPCEPKEEEESPATPEPSRTKELPPAEEPLHEESGAHLHFQKALAFVSNNRFDLALEQVQQGSELVPETSPIYAKLLMIRAEVLGRRGEYKPSLEAYQRVLEFQHTPDLTASLYYACGRLSVYLRDFLQALEYYTQELLLTRAVSGDSLAVARIYHDLAKVAESGLGDWTQALVYYEQALCVEVAVWKRSKEGDDDDKHRQDDLKEASLQIPETKKCIGRIHFALGNIDEALRLASHRFSLETPVS